MTTRLALGVALAVGFLTVACGDGGKLAADTAIGAAQTAFDAVKGEASTYVPDQVASIETALTAVKSLQSQGNYTQALSEATGLGSKITTLGDAAVAKKAELTKSWESLADMSNGVKAVQERVTALASARRLPANLPKEAFEGAKSGLTAVTAGWTEASEAFAKGNVMDAVSKAQGVKTRLAEVMTAIGMPVPDALK
jgi:hypothetical protein